MARITQTDRKLLTKLAEKKIIENAHQAHADLIAEMNAKIEAAKTEVPKVKELEAKRQELHELRVKNREAENAMEREVGKLRQAIEDEFSSNRIIIATDAKYITTSDTKTNRSDYYYHRASSNNVLHLLNLVQTGENSGVTLTRESDKALKQETKDRSQALITRTQKAIDDAQESIMLAALEGSEARDLLGMVVPDVKTLLAP